MAARPPLQVFITIDTEVWPRHPDWRRGKLRDDIARDISGITPEGAFGLPFQLRVLKEHGLRAVFFIEALFASAVGPEPLAEIVRTVQDEGHDVQLHIHSEWLQWIEGGLGLAARGQNLKDFTETDQRTLVRQGLHNLREAGARNVRAFRAGNYGANLDTLRALQAEGLEFDSSYNFCYLGSDCGLDLGEPLLQPRQIEGVWEWPISFFRDWPGHHRHAQICAVSQQEMSTALTRSWEQGWHSFVVVSHAFELIRDRKQVSRSPRPDWWVIERFVALCRFLSEHREQFQTMTFSEIDRQSIPQGTPPEPLVSGSYKATGRLFEQVARRMLSGRGWRKSPPGTRQVNR